MGEMVDIFEVFKNKKVIVTGDTGFKGSWLALWLHKLGADVLGYSLPPLRSMDHYSAINLHMMITHVDGDIRDHAFLKKVFDDFKPEFLFHLAAQALVRLSYNDPKLTFDTNIAGSVNILEMVRSSSSLRSVIYVTSDKCYRNREWIWGYRENDELGGHDPYSASKAAAEMVFSSYGDSFFKNKKECGVASVRAGNVIGGGDWADDRILPDTVKSLRVGKPVVLRNPQATRPWQHVLEPLSGYLTLAARLYQSPEKYSGSWNFGPRGESFKTVANLAEKIIECWGGGEIIINRDPHAPHEAGLLHLNCDKANNLLHWHPQWDFNNTVEKTVKWYRETDTSKLRSISISQINEYMGDN